MASVCQIGYFSRRRILNHGCHGWVRIKHETTTKHPLRSVTAWQVNGECQTMTKWQISNPFTSTADSLDSRNRRRFQSFVIRASLIDSSFGFRHFKKSVLIRWLAKPTENPMDDLVRATRTARGYSR